MSQSARKSGYRSELLLASGLIATGLVVCGLSLSQLASAGHESGFPRLAQATQPLQSTPGAETKPSAPADPATTGSRPQDVAPQPARPDAEAQQSGDKPALPPAPAEKTGDPIPTK